MTVVAAGFDKLASSLETSRFESRLSRLLEEPDRGDEALPSILSEDMDEDVDVFTSVGDSEHASVGFDAEEDLDIPDFLKN